jgi:hypothetical protein
VDFSYKVPGVRNWLTFCGDAFTEFEFSLLDYFGNLLGSSLGCGSQGEQAWSTYWFIPVIRFSSTSRVRK